jgi:hypothetical protein
MKDDNLTAMKKDMTNNFICFFRSQDGTLKLFPGMDFKMPPDLTMARIGYAISEVFDPRINKKENALLDIVGDLLQDGKFHDLEMVLRLHFPDKFDDYEPFQVTKNNKQ